MSLTSTQQDGPQREAARTATAVLLVDDDEETAVILREVLAEGAPGRYCLDWVATYEEGLEAIQGNRHDVYVVDYRLERFKLGWRYSRYPKHASPTTHGCARTDACRL